MNHEQLATKSFNDLKKQFMKPTVEALRLHGPGDVALFFALSGARMFGSILHLLPDEQAREEAIDGFLQCMRGGIEEGTQIPVPRVVRH